MIVPARVSVGSDSLLVINSLRRRAVGRPVTPQQYQDIIRGYDCRPDLCAHVGINGRVVTLRAAYTTFTADPEGLGLPLGFILRLVARADSVSVNAAEANWLRERFFIRGEDVRTDHQERFRLFICRNPAGVFRPRQEMAASVIGGIR